MKMLFIKKIMTSGDLDEVKKIDPNAEQHIWVVNNRLDSGRTCFEPMVPRDKSELKRNLFGGIKNGETIWRDGYYISSGSFDLSFDGTIRHQDYSKPLLAAIGVKVIGLNTNQDVSELLAMMAGKDQITTEELDQQLSVQKMTFFRTLEQELYKEIPAGEICSSVSVNEEIAALAKDCMLKFFPWLNVKITFSKTTEFLSENEKKFRADCDKLAEIQQQMNLDLQQKQSDQAYWLSIHELEENKREALAEANLREQDRLLALEEKDLAMKIIRETADDQVEKERAKIKAERLEILYAIQKNKELSDLELKEKEQQIKSQDAKNEKEKVEAEKNLELLNLKIQQERLRLEGMQEKLEYNKKYRAEKLKAVENQTFFNQDMLNRFMETICRNQKIRENQVEDLQNKITAAYGNIQSVKTVLARLIADQKKNCSLSMKREGVAPARAISLIDININTIKIGTHLKFKFNSPVSGYLTLFCVESSGNSISVLAPNAADEQIYINAGTEQEFPSRQSKLYGQVTQTGPEGFESVYAVVTPKQLTDVPSSITAEAIRLHPAEIDRITAQLQTLPPQSWAAAELSYQIVH